MPEHARRGTALFENHVDQSLRVFLLPALGRTLGAVHVALEQTTHTGRGTKLGREIHMRGVLVGRRSIEISSADVS